MATEIDAPLVETAPASQDPATAQPESQAGATTIATRPTQAELDAEFEAFYEARNPDAPAPAVDGEATVEPAPSAQPAQPQGEPTPAATEPAVEALPAQAAGEDDVEVPGQLRPRLHDQKDIALHIFAKANGITVLEAARRMLASEPQAQTQSIPGVEPGAAAPAPPAEPPASQAIQTQVEALAAEMKADRESENYLTAEYAEKAERLTDLKADLRFAKADEARAQREAQAREQQQSQAATSDFNSQWSVAAEAVNKANPDLANPKSILHNVAALVRREMADAKDPRLFTAAGPQTIVDAALARMKDMGLSPTTAPAAPAATPAKVPVPPSPAAPPPRRVAPASGSRGQQNGGPLQTAGAAVAATNDLAELEQQFDEAAKSGMLSSALRRR